MQLMTRKKLSVRMSSKRTTALFVLLTALSLFIVMAILVPLARTGQPPDWTGFGPDVGLPRYSHISLVQSPKTLWDWLQLASALVIPIVLAYVGITYTRRQSETELTVAENKRHEDLLQAYMDHITELVLNEKDPLSISSRASTRAVARSRTLAVLQQIDGVRKGIIVRFLYDLDLITVGRVVIDLSGANLDGVILAWMGLPSFTVRTIPKILTTQGAYTRATYFLQLYGEVAVNILRGKQPSDLSFDSLEETFKWMREQILSTDLRKINLAKVSMRQADLRGVLMAGANLFGSDLSETNLTNASLDGADLRAARLDKANMMFCGLICTVVAKAQLDKADTNFIFTSENTGVTELTDEQFNYRAEAAHRLFNHSSSRSNKSDN